MTAVERPGPLLSPVTAALAGFVEAGVLREAGVQVADAVARTVPGTTDEVLLAAALCVRSLQFGHVCIDIDRVAATVAADTPENPGAGSDVTPSPSESGVEDLPWPDTGTWAESLRSSPAVVVHDPVSGDPVDDTDPDVLRPLVFDGSRVYLERYWRYERQIGDALEAKPVGGRPAFGESAIEATLDRYFAPDTGDAPNLQRLGAGTALRRRVTVLAGGPGTGKTYTVARLLATVHELAKDAGHSISVALAAPTGKAAARLTEAVHQAVAEVDLPDDVAASLRETEGGTIHRLLGYKDGIAFRHDAANPLPHDMVVIDETSMVALPLMARLLDALRPEARLVLVGDPFQLTSVEAGAVLGDIVGPAARVDEPPSGPLADDIVVLKRVHRFLSDSPIAALADAVRTGDADLAIDILGDPATDEVSWVHPEDAEAMSRLRRAVTTSAAEVAEAADGEEPGAAIEAASELKVLCGTRFGPLGSYAWSDHVERQLPRLGIDTTGRWYVGRPVIVTRNDYVTGVFNGDTGLVVQQGDRVVVAMAGSDGVRTLRPSQLDDLETWWAMTIHKSQGSEFAHAVVSLPVASSRVLTNELLYTGITRGRRRVTVVASEEALRTAIGRRVTRASGLQDRLWP